MSFEKLKNWIIINGGVVHPNLDIKFISHGNRAIYATNPIPKNDKIISIPKNICINKDKIIEVPNAPIFDKSISSDVYSVIVLLHNIFVLKEKSFYYPYLSFLPSFSDLQFHPIFSFESKLNILNDISPIIISKLQLLKSIYLKTFEIISNLNSTLNFLPIDVINWSNILYCSLILQSRQWAAFGLVPAADLIQHSNSSQMLLSNTCEMTTPIEINTGDIVYDNYGVCDDFTLFTSFGFVDYNSPISIFGIPLSLYLKDSSPLEKIVKNEVSDFLKTDSKLFIASNGISISLIKLVRISNINDFDFIKIKDNPKYFDEPISIENEQKTFINLIQLFKSLSKILNDVSYPENTIEYNLLFLMKKYYDVINSSIKILLIKWMLYLSPPFNITDVLFK